MRRREGILLAVIAVITLLAGWIALPNNPGIHFTIGDTDVDLDFRAVQGLDLQGGLQVLLEANPPAGQPIDRDAMEAARSVIEQRVNAFGTTEPVIQLQGNNRIVVELPGIESQEDRERAIQLFGETGLLQFLDTGTVSPPQGTVVEPGQYPEVLTGRNLDPRQVSVTFDERSRPQIAFGWDAEGAGIFGEYTERNVGRYLAIVLDNVVLSAPRINSRIDSSGVITGGFGLEEARDIVTKLKYGALPVPMQVIQQREVGATLGEDSVRQSITAGTVGLGIVLAFMLIYYRLPGLLAGLALIIYALITFAIFKNPWAPVTITLAGIAGFILSIGMAVDANVLIFERMREELRSGRTLISAVEAGFARAWSSIWDSNVSTWITCAILFYLGTGIVRGFALTLAIGVAVSMFTAIIVTRTFLRIVVGTGIRFSPVLFGVRAPQREVGETVRPGGGTAQPVGA
ncbi:MAG: protein translocase subunit SecD [Chloroflexota bacterium]|nr:protein translocase subunit SecD [Chloroflexota bacterium]